MKLLIKLSISISLGAALVGYLYHHKRQERANSYPKHMPSQTKNLKKSLQNAKTSIQQLKAKLPWLRLNHSLIKWPTLSTELFQFKKAIKKLKSRTQN